MDRHRTVVIGLDGATFDIIKPMAQAGRLPAFAKLMSEGVHGPLRAWPNLNSAAAWSSIVTGYNPGKHGVHDFGSAPPQRGYTWHPMTALDRKKDPLWRLLSAKGKRVTIINVPISYPADPVNGFMLAGMDTPGLSSHGFAHPPELRDELEHQGIDYIIDIPNLGELSRKHPDQLPIEVMKMVEARSRTILYLMEKPWDAFMAVFIATDRVQHYYWPQEEFSLDRQGWAPIRETYRLIDTFLGEVLRRMDQDTSLFLVSDHGFGPMPVANRLLNRLLAKLGFLHFRQGSNRLQGKFLKALLLYGRRYIPYRFQYPLARTFRKLHIQAVSESMFAGIDWSRTRVFSSPHGGQVFINLKGRQPEGIVSPEDYDSLRETIQKILRGLIDPIKGTHLIKEVHRREDVFCGPYTDPIGDLIIEWETEAIGEGLSTSTPGDEVSVDRSESGKFFQGWTGTHRPYGIFIAYGAQIKKGQTLSVVTHYDITPTLLYLQGHLIPNDMDGRVLTDIFAESYLNDHPVQYGEPPDVQWKKSTEELNEEENRKIEERLRGLGYIE